MIQTIKHGSPVISVAISKENNFIMTGGEDKIAKLWDFNTGNLMKKFVGHDGEVSSVSFVTSSHTNWKLGEESILTEKINK